MRGEETGIACSEVPIGGGVNAENIKKCVAYLRQTQWSGVVSIECYGADENIRKSVEFLRGTLKSARRASFWESSHAIHLRSG